MKRIDKGGEPGSLLVYRKQRGTPAPSYADLPAKVRLDLQAALLEAQRGLCCYCQGRLKTETMKIEHFMPQSAHPELELDWGNLWAACPGNPGPPATQTCDTRKGNQVIELGPGSAAADQVSFKDSGRLDHQDPDRLREAEEVLGLNTPLLVRARKQAVQGMIAALTRKKGNARFTTEFTSRELRALQHLSTAPAYEATLVFWLNKRLSRA